MKFNRSKLEDLGFGPSTHPSWEHNDRYQEHPCGVIIDAVDGQRLDGSHSETLTSWEELEALLPKKTRDTSTDLLPQAEVEALGFEQEDGYSYIFKLKGDSSRFVNIGNGDWHGSGQLKTMAEVRKAFGFDPEPTVFTPKALFDRGFRMKQAKGGLEVREDGSVWLYDAYCLGKVTTLAELDVLIAINSR